MRSQTKVPHEKLDSCCGDEGGVGRFYPYYRSSLDLKSIANTETRTRGLSNQYDVRLIVLFLTLHAVYKFPFASNGGKRACCGIRTFNTELLVGFEKEIFCYRNILKLLNFLNFVRFSNPDL